MNLVASYSGLLTPVFVTYRANMW